jgi:ABC-type transport system involved in multi-copper enzyme maturation permease subunit
MTSQTNFLQKLLQINPIIVKEIRSRMRGPRVFVTLTIILLLMAGVMYSILQLILVNSRFSNVLSPQVGQILFAALAYLELFMVCVITPAVTSGSISGEKEKQTYEMLMATPLSPASILWGKLFSALSYILLLLFAGIPLASVVFIFGGVALREMIKALLVLLLIAISFGILGLFMSVLLGRSGRATVASFVAVLLLMIGPLFTAVLSGIFRNGEPPRWLLIPSPISFLASAIAPSMGSNTSASGQIFSILGGIFSVGVTPISQTSIPRPLYHYSIPFYILLSLILFLLSTRLLQPTRRWRWKRSELLPAVAAIVVVICLTTGLFFLTADQYEWALTPSTAPTPAPAILNPNQFPDKQVVPAAPAPGNEAPTPTPVLTEESGQTMDEAAQADIYAAVIRQLYTVDHTFGQNDAPNWSKLYVLSTTKDGIGDPNEPKDDPVEIQAAVTKAVSEALGDLPTTAQWIQTDQNIAKDPKTGQMDDGKSALITLGNIHVQEDGSVHVSASLYFASLGATGKTYILKKVDGKWVVDGKTGAEWIS